MKEYCRIVRNFKEKIRFKNLKEFSRLLVNKILPIVRIYGYNIKLKAMMILTEPGAVFPIVSFAKGAKFVVHEFYNLNIFIGLCCSVVKRIQRDYIRTWICQ